MTKKAESPWRVDTVAFSESQSFGAYGPFGQLVPPAGFDDRRTVEGIVALLNDRAEQRFIESMLRMGA